MCPRSEVEDLLGKLWLKGSFKGIAQQPAAATLIRNAWPNSIISKRGAETGIWYAIEAIAWIFAAGVSAGETSEHVRTWTCPGIQWRQWGCCSTSLISISIFDNILQHLSDVHQELDTSRSYR